ncbi:apolipoprotein N-acyltransferase [Uliginosibacterium sp. sgz301328]|uniref:apolipoprotein N-acyltransferase n=1 Tax=Uliginosibacterium sp. sgz301328 TaxID=3243764 RepID=UPI00359ECAF4
MTSLLLLLAGALSVFAYAPFGVFPLAFVCWGVLFHFLRDAKPGRAAWRGFVWGFGAFFAGLCWLYVALHRYGGMPAPLAVLGVALFCAYLALFPALSAWLYARCRLRHWAWNAIVAAAAWALGEWLRGRVLTGFPWLAIGYTQTPPSPLAGWAPVIGSYGVGFVLVLVAALLVSALKREQRRGALGLALVIVLSGAALRQVAWTDPVGEPTRVSLVQTNIAQEQKWRRELILKWLQLNLDMVRQHPARIVVLPETSLPLFDTHLPEGYLDALQQAAGGDVVVGIFTRDEEGRVFNSAITRGPGGEQFYGKHHLVPFGEFSPPFFGWFYRLANIPMSDQTRGPAGQKPLSLAGQKIAVNICYEDVFGEELLHALPEATLMLNMSNLAWYGNSHAQPQHLQIARMRALETGRPMMRATNTGMTAVIEPDGHVREVLAPFTAGALITDVRGYQGMTPYAHWANWPVVALSAIILLGALASRRRAG